MRQLRQNCQLLGAHGAGAAWHHRRIAARQDADDHGARPKRAYAADAAQRASFDPAYPVLIPAAAKHGEWTGPSTDIIVRCALHKVNLGQLP